MTETPASPLAQLADPSLLKTEGLIGGAWVAAQDASARFAVTDPATGAELAQVANLGPVDCAAAIAAAAVAATGDAAGHGSVRASLAGQGPGACCTALAQN